VSENVILLKQNGKTKEAVLSIDEYTEKKSNHLCTECTKHKPGLCPIVSTPSNEHIDSFPLITGGCQVYYDSNLSIIMYIDGCLRYKKAVIENEKDNNYKYEKNDEIIAKGAAVFSKREEEALRSIYRHRDEDNMIEATVDYAEIRKNYRNGSKSR